MAGEVASLLHLRLSFVYSRNSYAYELLLGATTSSRFCPFLLIRCVLASPWELSKILSFLIRTKNDAHRKFWNSARKNISVSHIDFHRSLVVHISQQRLVPTPCPCVCFHAREVIMYREANGKSSCGGRALILCANPKYLVISCVLTCETRLVISGPCVVKKS